MHGAHGEEGAILLFDLFAGLGNFSLAERIGYKYIQRGGRQGSRPGRGIKKMDDFERDMQACRDGTADPSEMAYKWGTRGGAFLGFIPQRRVCRNTLNMALAEQKAGSNRKQRRAKKAKEPKAVALPPLGIEWRSHPKNMNCDAGHDLFIDGEPANIEIQDASPYGGGFVLNSFNGDEDDFEMMEHGTYKSLEQAKLAGLLLATDQKEA